MRLLTTLVLIVVLCIAASDAWLWKENEYVKAFQSFISKFKRSYSTSVFAKKLLNFKTNMDKITNSAKIKSKYRLGVTRFADLSTTEFKKLLGARPVARKAGSFVEEAATELSESALDAAFAAGFDWTTKNVLRAARDQTDQCGSCWSFAAASTIEAAISIRDKKLSEYLSPQVAVDCAKGCLGCLGGYANCAFDYNKETGYFLETAAPYKAQRQECGAAALKPLGKIASYTEVQPSASAFVAALPKNPLWVTLNADNFQLYKDGIFDMANCSTAVNHAVVIVGAGAEAGTNYYKIRNSWRSDWGEAGHIRIASAGNVCGIHSYGGFYPVLGAASAAAPAAATAAPTAATGKTSAATKALSSVKKSASAAASTVAKTVTKTATAAKAAVTKPKN